MQRKGNNILHKMNNRQKPVYFTGLTNLEFCKFTYVRMF